ncbi:hypothetical protein [Amycolatopsis tolypomycina]|uniref:hypothetical protein n=1 Tax=Amycolatopsis tolypomycina TaxID=208445 RepID=UPI0033A177E2
MTDPEVRRLTDQAERMWRFAAVHRSRAARLAESAEPGAEHRSRLEWGLAKVSAEHAMAYRELAAVVETRRQAAGRPSTSPERTAAMNRSVSALRRAETHYHRSLAVPLCAGERAGDPAE